ncbi:MAG TPA: HU family DNA-binding protein [Acholeplasmataceae bacterium]|jgi:DNA-binding protein HU-beta|nr:HU family DNA-binding protein [Acholeplasmataceae bacterium]
MNKTELIVLMAEKAGVTQKVAGDVLDAFTSIVAETLGERREKVVITGFGTFEIRHRVQRSGVDPRTGERIVVPAQDTPAFRAGKLLKEAVKK